MPDIYQAPKSNLIDETLYNRDYGSLEKAVAGDYEFSIGDILSEAWKKTSGAKWVIHLSFAYYLLALVGLMLVIAFVTGLLISVSGDAGIVLGQVFTQVLINLLAMPMIMGIVLIGIRRSINAPINSGSVFSCFDKILPLFATMLLIYILVAIGFLLLVLPGIYLMVAYYMAMPLIVEKGLSPWQAMEISRKTITRKWFSVFILLLILGAILFISMIPFGLGMIWSVPMALIAYGIMYRNMFGVESSTVE